MKRSDGRLYLIRTSLPESKRLVQPGESLLYGVLIPARAVLFFERDQRALPHAGRPARILKQHQRQQPKVLRITLHQLA